MADIKSKNQKYFLVIFFVIIVAIAFFVWFNFFRSEKPAVITTSLYQKEIKINFNVLKDPELNNFDLFGEILPLEGNLGRENPFLPY